MVKGRLIGLAIGIILFFSLVELIFAYIRVGKFGWEVIGESFKILGISGYVIVLITAIFLLFSAFLPGRWSRVLREISYFCMFVLIIIVEMSIVSVYVEPVVGINLENCTTGTIFPSKEKLEAGGLVYDALAYTSCILTGNFPAEQGDIGWISFYIFYLILPFAFIFVLVHAIIGGIGLESWLNENVRRVITFIIAMYATRTMMGYFILQFVGYGAWGLGAIFVAIFLVGGLRNMIEGWFGIEKFGEETRKVIEDEIRWEREYATTAELIIKEAKGFAENNELTAAIQSLERLRNIPLWNRLDDEARRIVNSNLDRIRVLQDPRQFLKGLEDFEKVLKTWSHSKRI